MLGALTDASELEFIDSETEKFVELLKTHDIAPCTSEELGIH